MAQVLPAIVVTCERLDDLVEAAERSVVEQERLLAESRAALNAWRGARDVAYHERRREGV